MQLGDTQKAGGSCLGQAGDSELISKNSHNCNFSLRSQDLNDVEGRVIASLFIT